MIVFLPLRFGMIGPLLIAIITRIPGILSLNVVLVVVLLIPKFMQFPCSLPSLLIVVVVFLFAS